MNFNMILPGMKDVQIISIEEKEVGVVIHLQMPHQLQTCPSCGQKTSKIHERATYLFYKRRRYRCSCGKRFSESVPFIERYQRFSKEGNQALCIRSIKAKTFKEAAEVTGTSITTVIRRFEQVAQKELSTGVV